MRLPLIPPDKLTPEQKPLYDAFKTQIDGGFTGFKTVREDGALLGPWSVWIHEPKVGEATRGLLDAISTLGRLSDPVKQIAILAVGSKYKAAYEMYAHAAVGGRDGLSAAKMAAVCAGQKPTDMTPEEATAFNVTMAAARRRRPARPHLRRRPRRDGPAGAQRVDPDRWALQLRLHHPQRLRRADRGA